MSRASATSSFINSRPGSLTAEARDDAVAQRLWRESERIDGLA
jgi:hypothetical protein